MKSRYRREAFHHLRIAIASLLIGTVSAAYAAVAFSDENAPRLIMTVLIAAVAGLSAVVRSTEGIRCLRLSRRWHGDESGTSIRL